MLIYILKLIVGLAAILMGSNWLVDGASSFAKKLKIPSIIIGLTVVAFGTSMPEFVVSVIASMKGSSDIGVGNVLGSNVFNILMILGVTAIIYPITVKRNTVRYEIPFSILAIVGVFVVANDAFIDKMPFNLLSRADGLILWGFFVIFLYYTVITALSGNADEESEEVKVLPNWKAVVFFLLGLAGLVFGGEWFVSGAANIARNFGISEAVIGVTIVAVGTSFPELATSAVAAYKKNTDIAVGNIIGSNIFNIFFVLATSMIIKPINFDIKSNIDVLVIFFSSIILMFFLLIGKKKELNRFHGILFLILFVLYIAYQLIYRIHD